MLQFPHEIVDWRKGPGWASAFNKMATLGVKSPPRFIATGLPTHRTENETTAGPKKSPHLSQAFRPIIADQTMKTVSVDDQLEAVTFKVRHLTHVAVLKCTPQSEGLKAIPRPRDRSGR
jgi:hypothetical protein